MLRKTLPGVREAVEAGKSDEARAQAEQVVKMFARARRSELPRRLHCSVNYDDDSLG